MLRGSTLIAAKAATQLVNGEYSGMAYSVRACGSEAVIMDSVQDNHSNYVPLCERTPIIMSSSSLL